MPPPVFDNFLFDLLGQLTGGLVTDIKTMLAGMLVIGFTAMGADILIEKLGGKIKQHKESMIFAQNVFDSSKSFSEARSYRSLRDSSEEGSFDYDYYNSLYRAKLNESVSLSVKTGDPMSSGPGLFDDGGHDTHFDSIVSDSFFSVGDLEMDESVVSSRDLYDFTSVYEEPLSRPLSSSAPFVHSGDPGPTDADRPHFDDEGY